MNRFQLQPGALVNFASGARHSAHKVLRSLGVKAGPVVLVADPGLVPFGFPGDIEAGLAGAGFDVAFFTDVRSDPLESQTESARSFIEQSDCVAVIALGGGSALDLAKAATAAAGSGQPVSEYRLGAARFPKRRIPLVALPSTAGTGAEATQISVLTDEDNRKYWFWDKFLAPDAVILDPEITFGLPTHLTAATGADALVHAIEASTNRNASPANNLFAHEAIHIITAHLPAAVKDGQNADARGKLLYGSYLAGIAINNASTALAHNIGHALGSLVPIHHGRAVSVAMAATAGFVAEGNAEGFAPVCKAMGAEADATLFAETFRVFLDRIGLDLSLSGGTLNTALLREHMISPENRVMMDTTFRTVSEENETELAEMVLKFAA